jgi:hypothetical protein
MIGIIASLAKPLVTGAVSYLQTGQEMKAAEKENKARLLRDTKSNNHEWEMANLQDKDKWLRRISFTMFSTPFVVALFDPVAVEQYFNVALSAIPEWYVQIFCSMIAGVWSVSALKNTAPALVNGVVKALRK